MKNFFFALAVALSLGALAYFFLKDRSPAPAEVPPTSPPVAAAPPPVATPVPVVTPAAVAPESFAQKLQKTQEALPTADALGKVPTRDVHETPGTLIQAGMQIGEVAEAIEKDPSLAPQGMEFYSKCSRRDDLALSVRAHCLTNLRELAHQRSEKLNEAGIAPSVRRLAEPEKP